MGIQFYNGLNNYSLYNNYHREIPQVKPEDVKAVDEENKVSSLSTGNSEVNSPAKIEEPDLRSKIAPLEDISLTFNKEEDFDYLNSDSSVKSLDMQKAISDMQKDDVLKEYQYFVGSSNNLFSSEDGVVIAK